MKIYFRIIALIFIVSTVFFYGCAEDTTVEPVLDPEITFDVKGDLELRFESQGFMTVIEDTSIADPSLYILSFGSTDTIDNQEYHIVMRFFFKDREHTGMFDICGFDGKITDECVQIVFAKGSDGNFDQYIADSGEVSITGTDSTRIVGTFYFNAENIKNSDQIEVTDGTLNIYD